jgi:soluble lytic murein transglycosylase
MVRREWTLAMNALEVAKSAKSKETPSSSGGRLAYFQARALYASGDVAGGKRALIDVICDFPLSYYMLQAYARLSEQSEQEAKAVLGEVLAREPAGPFVIEDEDAFHTVGFVRAIELLRQGESDFARRELGKLGLLKEGANSQVLWAVAASYARAGFPQRSHTFPKFRVSISSPLPGRRGANRGNRLPARFRRRRHARRRRTAFPLHSRTPSCARSTFDPDAVSPAKAFGLMQLIVPTAKKVARDVGIACDETMLSRPETNVALGCRFLADLRAKFPVNPHLAVSAYNAGPGAPVRWIASRESDDFDLWVEQIPYEETRRYTKRVLASYAAYAFLYDRNGLDAALSMPKVVAP